MKYYIGVSEEADFDTIVSCFQRDYSGEDVVPSLVEREMGAAYVDGGDYEVYDRVDEPADRQFDRVLVETFFPFEETADLALWDEDFSKLRCVFFIRNNAVWSALSCEFFRITDVLDHVTWTE